MKHFSKRMWRSVVSVLMVACLAAGMCVPAFAATAVEEKTPVETLKYVSLGDSMANGYGLTNYDNNGYLTYGEEAYPNQFAEWLVTEGYANTVEHSQLAMSAMRAEDLHYILEFPVDDAQAIAVATAKAWDEEAWNATFSVGDYYTWDEFTDGRFRQNCVNVNEAAKMYQSAVADADIISVGNGNANFGVFLMGRMMNAIGFNGDASEDAWIEMERALAECDPATRERALALKAEIDEMFSVKLAEMNDPDLAAIAQPMYNAISYTVVSYVLNYAGALDRILQLNPDADVILVGIMNTMAGMDMTVESDGVTKQIPMSDVLALIVDPVNAYIAALPTVMQAAGNATYADATFYYAEAPEVECMVDTYETAIRNTQSVVRDRFVEEIVGENGDGMVWQLVSPMLAQYGITLVPITVADLQAYEANPYAFITNINKMYSCAVYLGFENAILEAAADSVIPMESFKVLASGDLSTVFAGVGAQLQQNPAALLNPVTFTDALTAALTSDDTVMGLLHLFGRLLIGNGLGAHPSVSGHDELSAAVIASYANGYTAQAETMKNLLVAGEYGKELAAGAYNYAVAKGYVAQAEAAVAQMEAELAALKAELVALKAQADADVTAAVMQAEAAIAELEAKIEALNAKLAALTAKVEAVADTAVEAIETAYTEINALAQEIVALAGAVADAAENVDSLLAMALDAAKAMGKEAVNEIVADIEATLANMAANGTAALQGAVDAFVADVQNAVQYGVDLVKAQLTQIYLDATTADYEISADSYYVALGDGTAASESYVEAFVAAMNDKHGVTLNYNNLASAGQSITDAYTVIAQNAADIQKADLITLGYGNNAFIHEAATQVWNHVAGLDTLEYDWVSLVGEEGAAYVYQALADLYNDLLAQGMDTVVVGEITVASLAILAVESYAYNAITYALNLPTVISTIREINPDAVVAVVGMHNPLEGAVLTMNDASIDVGSYLEDIVDGMDVYGITLNVLTGDAIYVQAQDVETAMVGRTMPALQFVMQYVNNAGLLDPTANGDAYIAQQIDNALNETVVVSEDIDNDGDLDMLDVMLLYSVISGKNQFAEGQGARADFNEDGVVNMLDMMALYSVVAGRG